MPYVKRWFVTEGYVWEPFTRPELPGRPPDWGIPEGGRPGQGLPVEPGQPLPPWWAGGVRPPEGWEPPEWERPEFPERPGNRPPGSWWPGWTPEHPWVPDEPGIGGGPILPGRPEFPQRPGQGLPPSRPGRPGGGWYFAPEVGDLGGPPGELPDLRYSVRGYVSYPKGRAGYPAWITAPEELRRRIADTGPDDEGPEVSPPDEPRYPKYGRPGEWRIVTNSDGSVVTWAWLLSMPEREPPQVEPPDPESPERLSGRF